MLKIKDDLLFCDYDGYQELNSGTVFPETVITVSETNSLFAKTHV